MARVPILPMPPEFHHRGGEFSIPLACLLDLADPHLPEAVFLLHAFGALTPFGRPMGFRPGPGADRDDAVALPSSKTALAEAVALRLWGGDVGGVFVRWSVDHCDQKHPCFWLEAGTHRVNVCSLPAAPSEAQGPEQHLHIPTLDQWSDPVRALATVALYLWHHPDARPVP